MTDERRNLTRVILAASVGNALEWYDFTVFGYFAVQIGGAFFPSADETRSLLLTWGTYGTAFLARPLGAAILGGYADRKGRRAALSVSILLMTLGTLLLAAMPEYRSIGVIAPCGVLLARVIQGFSAGGEFGGATAFMIEHAADHAPGRRGFYASFQFTSQALATAAGAGLAWLVSVSMSHAALDAWGFRLPFLLGLLIGPVGLYVRRHVGETPAFEQAAQAARPVREVLARHWGRVLLGAAVIAAGTAATYIAIYLPTYAQKSLHLAVASSFASTFVAALLATIVTPVAAHLSDRVGRLRLCLIFVTLLLLMAYPVFALLVAFPGAMMLAALQITLAILRASYSAGLPALQAELFPVALRGTGMSIAYTLGVVVFGGFAGMILTWLGHATGDARVPGYYLSFACVITLGALLTIRARVRLYE